MPCAGFSADTFDRYVLGLLEEPERSQLETQIQEQCPACLKGVQRSMNLWLVFASTLENAEPSADFRGRLVRIAELSRKVLTFPKNSAVRDRASILTSTLLLMCAVLAVLLFATWYAGRQSVKLETQPVTAALDKMAQDVANTKLELNREIAKRKAIEDQIGSSGHAVISQTNKLRQDLSEAQAALTQYRGMVERDQKEQTDNASLLADLATPGARLISMKAGESASTAVAYALLFENAKLVFVGANLPKPAPDHTFQLWLIRKDAPKVVSAGVFSPDTANRAVVFYDQPSLLSGVSSIAVTEEPGGGSPAPTESHLLDASASPSAD